MSTRSIYHGDAELVGSIFLEEVRSPSDIRYHEKIRKGTKMQKKAIWQHRAMLRKLRKLQPNLAFTKTMFRKQLAARDKKGSAAWRAQLPEAGAAEWVDATEARIRNMCRHAGQAENKNPAARFVQKLLKKPYGLLPPT